MKKYFNELILLLILVSFIIISYFYIPSSAKLLHKRIYQSNPSILNENRQNLIGEYGNYIGNRLTEKPPGLHFYWYSNQRKISDLRIKEAVKEIKFSKIEKGKIKVWNLLNMGSVIKTDEHTIAFDTANLFFSQAYNELTQIADIFIVTHADSDHYDSSFLKKAVANNKKMVFLKGFGFSGSSKSNTIFVTGGETIDIDGIKITAFQTDHRGDGNFSEPSAWFVVEVDGFKILHTGDGRDFKNKNEQNGVYAMKDFDILLGNIMLHPYNIRDLRPKVFVPLHLYKFMSGKNLFQESTIEAVLSIHKQYDKDLQDIEIKYLLPGESFIYP